MMKTINKVNGNPVQINGRTLPNNAVYGKMRISLSHKAGYIDKHAARHARASKKAVDLVYYIDDFSLTDTGALRFRFWDMRYEKWVATTTDYIKAYQAVFDVAWPYIQQNCVGVICTPWERRYHAPNGRKKAQVLSDSVYGCGKIGYALSNGVNSVDDQSDVTATFRPYVTHTNHVH